MPPSRDFGATDLDGAKESLPPYWGDVLNTEEERDLIALLGPARTFLRCSETRDERPICGDQVAVGLRNGSRTPPPDYLCIPCSEIVGSAGVLIDYAWFSTDGHDSTARAQAPAAVRAGDISVAVARDKGPQPKLGGKQKKERLGLHDVGDSTITDLAELFKITGLTGYRTIQYGTVTDSAP